MISNIFEVSELAHRMIILRCVMEFETSLQFVNAAAFRLLTQEVGEILAKELVENGTATLRTDIAGLVLFT